jgi:uncharacterized protein
MRNILWVLPFLFAGVAFPSEPIHLDTGTGVLQGTLELPTTKPPYPVVLLIAGSGPTDRDGNSAMLPGKNDSLRMVAQEMAAHGIASLRYDKRGIGESKVEGLKEENLLFQTYVDDAVRWGKLLREDKRFCSLIIAGHSEGSLIGLLTAQEISADGYISLEGPGQPAGQLLLHQLEARPISADSSKELESIVQTLEQGHRVDQVPGPFAAIFRPSVQPYLISWFRYDPAKEIAKLRMPVLLIQGTTDIQVGVDDAKRLAGADAKARLTVIDGMNHVLKRVPADSVQQRASYGDPSLPLAPGLMDEITNWINQPAVSRCRSIE